MWGLWYTVDVMGGGYQSVMTFYVLVIDIFFYTFYCDVMETFSIEKADCGNVGTRISTKSME